MIETLSLHKVQRLFPILCIFLCSIIIMSNLFTNLHKANGFSHLRTDETSMYPSAGITIDAEHYPLQMREQGLSKNVFLSSLSSICPERIPMRFPIPPMIFLLLTLFYLLSVYTDKKRIRSYAPILIDNHYTIRYIHDQNGESYHSFLF